MIVQILLCKSVCIFSPLCDRKRLFRVPASIIKYQDFEFEPALESFKGGRRHSQYSLCIPSHEKISSDGHYVCTLYFQERTGNIYHHRITITIVTAIDGVEVTKLTQLCQFILWFSLILLTLKCTSIYLSQYRNSLDVISSDNPL